ncbi:MAG TPA: D-alanyl-D-alanine carboxypeptidase/D-alanyl-D-alanine-endopeptidase [Mycobacteriales bacterium]
MGGPARWGTVAGCLALLLVAGGSIAQWRSSPSAPGPSAGSSPGAAPTTPSVPTVPAPVLATLAAGREPTAAGVARALAGPLADPRLGRRVSATVVDVASGGVLLDRGAEAFAVPASVAKLATAAALLSVVEPDLRLATTVLVGSRPGEVVLVGGGDPTLSAAPRGTPPAYPGAARLADLAAAARRAGAGKVTRVVVDGTLFTGPAMGPGWDPVDVTGGYVAPITAVMLDAGRVGARRARSMQPDLDAGRALAAALGSPGAQVVRGEAAPGVQQLAQVESAPVVRLVEQMLLESDNVLAEALARQVAIAVGAPASFAGAVGAVRAALGQLGLPASGDGLVDGSGLSLRNAITPALLAAIVRSAARPEHRELHALVPALPVSGYDGTLDARFRTGRSAPGAGEVRAKTGTLSGVSSLAGLVRGKDGRLLAFAVLADGIPAGGTLGAEDALDVVAATLATCTCR